MLFLCFLALLAIAYLAWRVVDQLPDIVFRLGEIQRDLADIRRGLDNLDRPPSDSGSDQP